jgi:hypothetical protein
MLDCLLAPDTGLGASQLGLLCRGRSFERRLVMADLFLSYARQDVKHAETLAGLLEANGLTVWWDRRMIAGDNIRLVIGEEIEEAKAVIVLWSQISVESDWVLGEADTAHELKKLVPIKIGECKLPINYRGVHTPEVYKSKAELNKLAKMLSDKIGTPSPSTATKIEFTDRSSDNFLAKLANPLAFGEEARLQSQWGAIDFRLIKKDPVGAIIFYAAVGLIFGLTWFIMFK